MKIINVVREYEVLIYVQIIFEYFYGLVSVKNYSL